MAGYRQPKSAIEVCGNCGQRLYPDIHHDCLRQRIFKTPEQVRIEALEARIAALEARLDEQDGGK